MANSWNGPQLGSPIRTDVPELQKKLIALLKQDPTSVANIPSGAKRLVNTSGVRWQVQQYNGSSWAAIGKLMHDVDKLDGYHAAITPAASTIAVRNADKKLEGDITGNAATASSAATLSETLPVNKGGTGATTSAAARANLGVPPTSHASPGTEYGLGSNLNYGHVRGDGETTDVISGEIVVKDVLYNNRVSLTKSGLFGVAKYIGGSSKFDIDTEDFDTLILHANSNTGTNPPGYKSWLLIRQYFHARTTDLSVCSRKQIAYGFYSNEIFTRYFRSGGGWYPWVKVVNETDLATSSAPGIVKPGTGMSVDSAGSLGVDATVVRTTGNQDIEGAKKFTDLQLYSKSLSVGTTPTSTLGSYINIFDNNGVRYAGLAGTVNSSGDVMTSLFAKPNDPDSKNFKYIRLIVKADGTSYADAPTPKANSNANHIATTEWVRNYTLPTGTLIPSLATSMTGYLLCNGAAVSRTTYANLFSIIGTEFGAGNGSTTFNLPDFRNRVFWGANGNLMSMIEAGLPNIEGEVNLSNSQIGVSARDTTGCFSSSGRYYRGYNNALATQEQTNLKIDASHSSSIYGNSTTVQPPAIAVNIFIKY